MAERGNCKECGKTDVEFCKNGNRFARCCRECFNKDSSRRMRLHRERKRNNCDLPYGQPCACCQRPMTKPMQDHCHKSNAVRGWLCMEDNCILGAAHDDPIAFLDFAERATMRAARCTGERRSEALGLSIRQLQRAAYLLKHLGGPEE